MTFEAVLDQAIAMLQRRGRVTYRTLQRQFQLDEDALNDLKDELLYAHPQVHDEAGRGLVWAADLAISASAPCIPRWAGWSRPARNCLLPSSCAAPWR
jgi:hypothetical protein